MGLWDDAPPLEFVGMPRLTPRMAARIQGFPDEWQFFGRKTAAYRQIGNAFPPPVAASNVEFLTFNIIDRKIEKEQNNSSKLNSSDFNFLFLEDRDRLEAAQKYISEAVNKCCVMDHYAAVQQAVNGDDITKFPITGQDAIHAVLLERTAILLGWLFLEFEIKPDFFKSEIGKLIVESFVLRFLQDIGPNCTLTVDVYKQYIAFCTMIGKDATQDSKYISALKHLHSIYMRSCS